MYLASSFANKEREAILQKRPKAMLAKKDDAIHGNRVL